MVGKKIVVGSVLLSLVACSDATVFGAIADPVGGARVETPGTGVGEDAEGRMRMVPGPVGGLGARGTGGDTGWVPGDTGVLCETGEDPYGDTGDTGHTGDTGREDPN